MNIAITFLSEDYLDLVSEVLSDCSEAREVDDPDLPAIQATTLRAIMNKITETLDDIFYVGKYQLEECVTGMDPYERFVARVLLKFKINYPGAEIISLCPINLKGSLVLVMQVPEGSVFNINAIR